MKLTITIAALLLTTTAATANGIPQQLDQLRDRIAQVDREDQRAVSGTLNANTGVMTIVTQDMAEGKPGKGLSPRSFDVDLSALKGQDGADGQDGTNGKDGVDGTNGRDGQDFDAAGHAASLAAVTALGSLQMLDPLAGETTWSMGFGGQFDGDDAFAAGIMHGFTDDLSGYMTLGTSLDGKGASYGIGLSGRF